MNISAPLSQGVEDLTPALALPFRAKSQKGEVMFKCFFCNNEADRLAYYSKDYWLAGMGRTIENPTLCCSICFDSPRIMNQISPLRGGKEGVYCFLFSSIGKWTPKQLAYHLSKKGWELNHLSSKPMRKLLWRIHYVNKPRKPQKDAGSSIDVQQPGL